MVIINKLIFTLVVTFSALWEDQFLVCARPAGYRNTSGTLNNVGYNASWWSSSPDDGSNAWYRNVNSGNSNVNRNWNSQANGYSVRCVRDLILRRKNE